MAGKPRGKYNSTKDITGKVGKEPPLLSAFLKAHKVSEMMMLTKEEQDSVIEKWLTEYAERRMKIDKTWDYPTIPTKTLNEIRNKRTDVDKGWHL